MYVNHQNDLNAVSYTHLDVYKRQCQMIAPYLEQMDTQLGDTVSFYKVDVDQERMLAAQQDITAMPLSLIHI